MSFPDMSRRFGRAKVRTAFKKIRVHIRLVATTFADGESDQCASYLSGVGDVVNHISDLTE